MTIKLRAVEVDWQIPVYVIARKGFSGKREGIRRDVYTVLHVHSHCLFSASSAPDYQGVGLSARHVQILKVMRGKRDQVRWSLLQHCDGKLFQEFRQTFWYSCVKSGTHCTVEHSLRDTS